MSDAGFLQAHPPRRIAVFRALQLGDLLVAVPALRSLRAGFPDAEITLIGLPWARSFVRRFHRYLDRFVPFAGYPGIDEVEVVPERTERFLAEQRAYGYDLVIQLHGSGETSLPAALALGGTVTAGYYTGAPPPGLTVGAPYPEGEPEVLRNLGLIRLLGCPDRGTHLEFPLTPADRVEAEGLLHALGDRPWIGLHPGARAPSRRWPAESFAAVGEALAQRHGAQIVVTGGPGDEDLAAAVTERMRQPALDISGQTSLAGLAAVIAQLDLYICNDSGPAHLATALDVPSVTIFGPVDPARWAALDRQRHPIVRRPVACSPCLHTACPIDHRCLRWLAPETVLAVADTLLTEGAVACSA